MTPAPLVQLVDLTDFVRFEHEAMATTFTLYLPPGTGGHPPAAVARELFAEVDRIEGVLSFYRENSDVSRINRAAAGEVLRIDEITHRCLLTALEVSAASGGVFDPFLGHRALLAKNQATPSHLLGLPAPEDDAVAVLAVDPARPVVEKLSGRRWLDLGAVGKGAALDAVAAGLSGWEITSAVLVAGGSSIRVIGPTPPSAAAGWTLRLTRHPGQGEVWLRGPFSLGASGGGFQPEHVIAPARSTRREQTVVLAPDAALADALSTAALLMSDDALAALFADTAGGAVLATLSDRSLLRTGVFQSLLGSPPLITLVIPCWREQVRLPPFLAALAVAIDEAALPVELLVVDDGSPPAEREATRARVESLRARFPQVRALLDASPHRGKGHAVYAGWRAAGTPVAWLGFVDADGAIPAADVVRGLALALRENSAPPRTVIAASRYHQNPAYPVRRGFWRQRTGGWFARWCRTQLQHPVEDAQCGFKLLPAAWWRARAPWRCTGYEFDLELILAARDDGLDFYNLPVAWREIAGSHVSIADGLALVRLVRAWRTRRA